MMVLVRRSARPTSAPRILAPALTSLVGRGLGGLLLLGFQAIVARRVGIEGLGFISLALAVTSIAAVIGRRGGDLLVLREVSLARERGDVDGVYRAALRCSVWPLMSLMAAQIVFALTLSPLVFGSDEIAVPMAVMALAVPAYGLVALQGEALKGHCRVGAGTFAQSIVGPGVAAVALLIWRDPSATTAAAMFALGTTVAAAAGHGAWRRSVATTSFDTKPYRASFVARSRPFLLTAIWTLGLTWAPILAAGALADTVDAGRYAAADRIAQLLPMMLVAVNAAVGPVVAPLFAAGNVETLTSVLRRCTAASSAIALVVCGGLALAAPLVLTAFDAESATSILRLLLLGHVVVLACGPASVTLAMTGAELTLHRVSAAAFVLLVLLLAALVPLWGANGAAIAAAAAWGGSRLVIALLVWSRLLTSKSPKPMGLP